MPYFKGKFVDDITTPMVADCHFRKRANPTDANRAIAVLSAIMKHAVQQGMRATNPCKGIERYQETAKDDWIDEHQLPAFLDKLDAVVTPVGDLLRFMAVTGWRVSEARLMRWEWVNLRRLIVRIPDENSKIGVIDRHLSADAAELINRQSHREGFVFSNREGRFPTNYKDVRNVLADTCKAAGIPKLTPHALRHTMATHTAIAGATAHELREAGGWKTLAMANRYVSRAEALGKSGAEKAAAAINIHRKPKADVKEFTR
ncbi:site-specific integrase [Rhizobium sp. 007]|uniref:tyrosine-type recombinase/integrase n=1 Tax=Rhizobium sp. 007 TaxID=2785056 RepID=UPI00188FADB6|nr:site-specific integrase [Rhizobium sp. 007]QPB21113.1 site-specific integrase [Rhizobium sp. 007]